MKSLFLSVLVMLMCAVFAGTAMRPDQSTHDADVRDLQRLETIWNEAHEHGDADALEALWADDMEP